MIFLGFAALTQATACYKMQGRSLIELCVTSSQLGKKGMLNLMEGLKSNQTLKELTCRSYNVERYYWSVEELGMLRDLISTNQSIQNINLPDNQIANPQDILILSDAYKLIQNRELPHIKGFELRLYSLPEFNKETAMNGDLDKASNSRFQNHF